MKVRELMAAINGASSFSINANDGAILESELGPKEVIGYLDANVDSFRTWVYASPRKNADGSDYVAHLIHCTITLEAPDEGK